MKLTFLGTSHGAPGKDRYCTSMMIEVGSDIYLIDAGAPIADCLTRLGKDFSNVKGVFITHPHGDHIDGLFNFLSIMNSRYRSVGFDLLIPSQKMIDAIKDYMSVVCVAYPLKENGIRFSRPNHMTAFDNGQVKVTYFENAHMEKGLSFSLLFEAEGKKLVFSGDLSGDLNAGDFPKYPLENKVDLTVLEMAHFYIDKVEPYLEKLKTKVLLFNHINREEKFQHVLAADKSGKYGYKILAPKDNDEFIV